MKAPPKKLRVCFAYLETLLSPGLGPASDKYDCIRLLSDLPLGLASVRAYCEADPGLRSAVTMTNRFFTDRTPEKEALARILAAEPEIAAFSCFLWNARRTYRLCERLKKARPSVRIVVGGPEVPRDPAALALFLAERPFIDAAVGGEGETAFSELLRAAARGKKDAFGPRTGVPLKDISRIPSPYLSGAVAVRPEQVGMLCVETSRGCPWSCAFCDYYAGAHKVREYPLERFRAELDALKESGYRGAIYITDATLNAKVPRALEVFRILQDWPNVVHMELSPELFKDSTIEALGKVPCVRIAVGMQSTNAAALKNMGRPLNLARCTENIRKLNRFPNIRVEPEFILGLPGDDYASFKNTLDWVLAFDPVPNITIFDLVLLPNAPLASMKDRFEIEVDDEGLVRGNLSFSEEELTRASRLVAAYARLRGRRSGWEDFVRRMRAGKERPSSLLEKEAARLVEEGLLPKTRIVGQGGRHPAVWKKGRKGTPDRWVELIPEDQDVGSDTRWW